MQDSLVMFYIMAGLVALLIGLGKGGVGGMLGVLTVPLLSLAMPTQQVVGLVLPILIVGDVFAISAHWRHWDTRLFLQLMPGGILGILAGTLVLAYIPPLALRRGLGILVLLFIIYRLFIEKRIAAQMAYQPRGWHGWLAGSFSGLTSTIAHAGGPPISVYLLLQKIEPRVFVATSALYFAILNLIKVPSYLAAGLFSSEWLLRSVWITPLLPLGVVLGRLLSIHIKREVFEYIVLSLLAMTVVLLFAL
ncbi:MAG: sulfite exporter TauE/SafE family protein [Anaerolineae bacterium]|nr:sulfite exporter TauE/SafE family protein [Anaerolineae bacterium]